MTNVTVTNALHIQEQAIAGWLTQQGAERAIQMYTGLKNIHPEHMSDMERDGFFTSDAVTQAALGIIQTSIEQLREARVYAITDPIAAGLSEAQGKLPKGIPFAIDMLPAASGFAYIEGNRLLVPHPTVVWDVIRAISWAVAPAFTEDEPVQVRIQVWVEREGKLTWRQHMVMPEGYEWDDDEHMQERGDENRIAQSRIQPRETARIIVRFLLALGAFVSEKIIVADAARPDRGTRRRMQRELGGRYVEPEIQVLRMRELEHVRSDRYGLGGPDWSCSWIVQSHWRKQWHPSTGEHRLKLIRPYLKGDTTKPLRVSGKQVRLVVR